jgi:hypothetical protein
MIAVLPAWDGLARTFHTADIAREIPDFLEHIRAYLYSHVPPNLENGSEQLRLKHVLMELDAASERIKQLEESSKAVFELEQQIANLESENARLRSAGRA